MRFLPGEDVQDLHPGLDGPLVTICLALDVLLALDLQQRLAIRLFGLPLGAFFFTFATAQAGCGDGDDQGGLDDGLWFHRMDRGSGVVDRRAVVPVRSVFAGASADRAALEPFALALWALHLTTQSGALAVGAGRPRRAGTLAGLTNCGGSDAGGGKSGHGRQEPMAAGHVLESFHRIWTGVILLPLRY